MTSEARNGCSLDSLVRNQRGIPLWVWDDGSTTMTGTLRDVLLPLTSFYGRKMNWEDDDIVPVANSVLDRSHPSTATERLTKNNP